MFKILILGISGMLGSTVYEYFRKKYAKYHTAGSYLKQNEILPFKDNNDLFQFDASTNINEQLKNIYETFSFDYIINCIGIIKPYCQDTDMNGVYNAVKINALFPHELAKSCNIISKNIKIIQIATDCVYSGKIGNYNEFATHEPEDVYGKTKSLGEVKTENFLNIRCSIIGKEIQGKKSLLEWFLSHKDGCEINGYAHHFWNGVTTLQFAQFCEKLIAENKYNDIRQVSPVIHYIANEMVSKYQLLDIFNLVFKRNIHIKKIYNEQKVNRTLSTLLFKYPLMEMLVAIKEYKEFTDNTNIYEK